MPQEPEQLDGESKDVWDERLEELRQEFPEVLSEDKVDCENLKKLVGEEHVAEGERYNFSWAGKSKAFEEVKQQTSRTLQPDKDESKNFDDTENIFIEGENLEALKILQKSYHSSVKMIYIDPPYNTGKDFVYKDSWQISRQDYEEEANNVDEEGNLKEGLVKNTKSGRYHSHWLNMMYPRLYLARNLLQEDGVIFVSIDDNEVHHLRMVMDEIFGEKNFAGKFIRQSKIGGGSDSRHIVKEHEYILVYAKSISDLDDFYVQHDEDYLKRYKEEDKNGRFFWDTLARPGLKNPIEYTVEAPDGTKIDGQWIISKERFEQDYEEGKIRFKKKDNGEWSVQFKQYLSAEGKKPRSLTTDFGGTYQGKKEIGQLFDEEKVFSYPKSVQMTQKLLSASSFSSGIVLDFFAGSGTTAHAVMKQNAEDGGNRRCISIQLPEETNEDSEARDAGYDDIAEIARERIRRAGEQIKEEYEDEDGFDPDDFDDSFKAFAVSDSNFKQWVRESVEDEEVLQKKLKDMLDNTKEGVKKKFMLYELILKLGIDLNAEVEDKGDYYMLSDGGYAISLADEVGEALVDDVLGENPSVFACLDSAFDGNDELKTNTALQMQDADIEFKVV
jgi:adenine-specific DNA-methyltransferase